MHLSYPHTLSTLIALMVAVQCCTYLLSKLLVWSELSVRIACRSKALCRRLFGLRWPLTRGTAPTFPQVSNGALVFDKPCDRSGLETPTGGLGFENLVPGYPPSRKVFTDQVIGVREGPPPWQPEVTVKDGMNGRVGVICSDGVLRIENTPTIPNGTVVRDFAGQDAKVIHLAERLGGEQS